MDEVSPTMVVRGLGKPCQLPWGYSYLPELPFHASDLSWDWRFRKIPEWPSERGFCALGKSQGPVPYKFCRLEGK